MDEADERPLSRSAVTSAADRGQHRQAARAAAAEGRRSNTRLASAEAAVHFRNR
jgi:hypothetical protein